MLGLWILATLAGIALTLVASKRAITVLTGLMEELRVPPFVLGLTLVAIGTDLPEIANSLVASASGHGEINVGDSIGSAATQVTLALGLLPFFTEAFAVNRRQVAVIGLGTLGCLGLCIWAVSDGVLGGMEAGLLLLAWIASSVMIWQLCPPKETLENDTALGHASSSRSLRMLKVLFYLGLVGAGAALAINGLIEIARAFEAPEYLISFLALSLGTSLPELVVDVTALNRGHRELAIGDIFGSSLVDASLSIGIGPLLFTNYFDAGLAVRGGWIAFASVALAALLLIIGTRHNRLKGAILLIAYAAFYPLLTWT